MAPPLTPSFPTLPSSFSPFPTSPPTASGNQTTAKGGHKAGLTSGFKEASAGASGSQLFAWLSVSGDGSCPRGGMAEKKGEGEVVAELEADLGVDLY